MLYDAPAKRVTVDGKQRPQLIKDEGRKKFWKLVPSDVGAPEEGGLDKYVHKDV